MKLPFRRFDVESKRLLAFTPGYFDYVRTFWDGNGVRTVKFGFDLDTFETQQAYNADESCQAEYD
jgi:hypothetical protein